MTWATRPSSRDRISARRWQVGLVAGILGLGLLLSSCAKAPATSVNGALPQPTSGVLAVPGTSEPSPSLSGSASVTPSAGDTGSAGASPSGSGSPSSTPTPTDPFASLSAEARKEFKGCLTKSVGPNSSGHCAALVVKKLKNAGFYPWASTSRINVAGANAILNYQRSRGLKATAYTTTATWVALATQASEVPESLPAKCLAKGIMICVDQAHRKLSWVKNGVVIKTFPVRLGGWNYLKKKGQKQGKWKVYATADGTWKVYDKQVDPKSENYGSGAMPYSTMFYPDMYVHYSPGFHAVGYAKSSHGCVNLRYLSQAQWVFKHTPIGTTVYIFSPKAA